MMRHARARSCGNLVRARTLSAIARAQAPLLPLSRCQDGPVGGPCRFFQAAAPAAGALPPRGTRGGGVDVDQQLSQTADDLFQLRMRGAHEELENPMKIRQLRRDIARLKTIQRERELSRVNAEES